MVVCFPPCFYSNWLKCINYSTKHYFHLVAVPKSAHIDVSFGILDEKWSLAKSDPFPAQFPIEMNILTIFSIQITAVTTVTRLLETSYIKKIGGENGSIVTAYIKM